MENSPLNKAHQLDRRAAALLKQKKFEESIENHRNAIKYLHEAMQLTENPHAKESIQLQIDSHQKQIDAIRIKKTQYEDLQRYQASIRDRAVSFDGVCENREDLQHEILRTMEMHDSLVEVLMRKNGDDELNSYTVDEVNKSSNDGLEGINISGKKHEVDNSTLLEEFKCLSEKLREFVKLLVVQLDEKDSEIARLKIEIHKLECDKNKDGSKPNNSLKVITDSSGGTSPYVFSPCSELSPEVHEIRGLPALAPLEMPNFDFSSLVKNTNNLNLNSTNN